MLAPPGSPSTNNGSDSTITNHPAAAQDYSSAVTSWSSMSQHLNLRASQLYLTFSTSAAVPSPINFYKEHFCDRSSVRPLPVSNAGKRLRAVDSFTFPQNCQIKDQPPLSTLTVKLMALCSDSSASSDNSSSSNCRGYHLVNCSNVLVEPWVRKKETGPRKGKWERWKKSGVRILPGTHEQTFSGLAHGLTTLLVLDHLDEQFWFKIFLYKI